MVGNGCGRVPGCPDGAVELQHRHAEYRELYVRWLQWATLLPFMRTLGSRKCNVQNAHTCNNEWWSYGEENTPMIVSYIQLRYQLKAYLQALFEQIHHTYDAAVYGFRTDRSADREDDAGECQCYHAAVHVWLAAACHPVTIPNAPSGRCICRRKARVRQSRGRTGGQTRHMLVD